MSQPRLIRRSLADFFRDLVRGAMRTHEVESSEPAEHYLVTLLERFAKPAPGLGQPPAGARVSGVVAHARAPIAARSCKHVGDTALFLSGLFMEHLERRAVSTDYYMSLGRVAYHQLAALAPSDAATPADVFAEIAGALPRLRPRALRDQLRRAVPRRRADGARLHALAAHPRPARRAVAAAAGDRPVRPGTQVAALTRRHASGLRLRATTIVNSERLEVL